VGQTIVTAVAPLLEEGTGEVKSPYLEFISRNLALVPGDLALARVEDELSSQWSRCLEGNAKAFRITTTFHSVVRLAAEQFKADLDLLDVGPNLGAPNRCALIAADFVAVPLVPDLYSLQGLRNLGPTLQKWRAGWQKRLSEAPPSLTELPTGKMCPAGYVVLQHVTRQSRPVKAYLRWAERIPEEYRAAMKLNDATPGLTLDDDPHCLAQLKHYRSLMPLAMEAGKPIFHLKPADGAIGAHAAAVAECGRDFRRLARRLAESIGLALPEPNVRPFRYCIGRVDLGRRNEVGWRVVPSQLTHPLLRWRRRAKGQHAETVEADEHSATFMGDHSDGK